jgi:osmotically-inducible protein OsmY
MADADARGIRIETEEGIVILRGTVRFGSEIDAAKCAAWAASGVSTVISQLVVSADAPVPEGVLG